MSFTFHHLKRVPPAILTRLTTRTPNLPSTLHARICAGQRSDKTNAGQQRDGSTWVSLLPPLPAPAAPAAPALALSTPRHRNSSAPAVARLQSLQRLYSTMPDTAAAAPAVVRELKSKDELDQLLSDHSKALVIDFHALWCGPCRMIAPKIAELATRFLEGVVFVKVDVDQFQDLAQQYGITSMPTFAIFSGGKRTDTVVGANPSKLEEAVKKVCGS